MRFIENSRRLLLDGFFNSDRQLFGLIVQLLTDTLNAESLSEIRMSGRFEQNDNFHTIDAFFGGLQEIIKIN